ncbi:hypothetical protein MP638_000484 [Amoeboaphelidium occidentale]|nr:hypothetical protein MP638_000484 [Amoeboaphelidium occidentale]
MSRSSKSPHFDTQRRPNITQFRATRDPLFRGHSHLKFSPIAGLLSLTFGLICKSALNLAMNTHIVNKHNLEWILNRPKGVPVITAMNHLTVLDDPLIWGCLPWSALSQHQKVRWSLAAHDICFTNILLQYFFSYAQGIPIRRGSGVFQPSMYHAVEILQDGGWVNVFPEGKVNPDPDTLLPFRWGVGRLLMDTAQHFKDDPSKQPYFVPIYLYGLEHVKPLGAWFLSFGKNVTISFGDPVPFGERVVEFTKAHIAENIKLDREAFVRHKLTESVYNEMLKLKYLTKEHHLNRFG